MDQNMEDSGRLMDVCIAGFNRVDGVWTIYFLSGKRGIGELSCCYGYLSWFPIKSGGCGTWVRLSVYIWTAAWASKRPKIFVYRHRDAMSLMLRSQEQGKGCGIRRGNLSIVRYYALWLSQNHSADKSRPKLFSFSSSSFFFFTIA